MFSDLRTFSVTLYKGKWWAKLLCKKRIELLYMYDTMERKNDGTAERFDLRQIEMETG